MKKKLILVSIEKEARDKYLLNLRQFFKDEIDICGYYVNGQQLPDKLTGDVVLYTSQELIPELKSHISDSSNLLFVSRTFFQGNIKCLNDYPAGTKAIFYDYSEQTAKQLISRITEYGILNIVFSPVGRDTPEKVIQELFARGNELFIIAGLGDLVSVTMDEVLDIGWAAIDAKTLLDISILLDCYNDKLEKRLFRYMRMVINVDHGILYYLKASLEATNKYKMIMELLEDGILIYDKIGIVTHCNNILLNMFSLQSENVIGQSVGEIGLPDPLREEIIRCIPVREKLITVSSTKRNYVLTIHEITILSEVEDFIVIIKSADRIQKQGSRVRLQMKDQGFRAKYNFGDILGSSAAIQDCKQKALRMAMTDKTVLITGESGVGKELFANAIHNASSRCNMPFVAVNCAALTPTLLESELFGYESGAFTNSRSEGHVGLFESAHEGTIFLDEIGEIPLELQAKLLRVIEEQEIRRVGSHKTVPIDVRVIAATNQNLYELCEKKKFREDLYYRLTVLPLQVPPLRERREDIPLLTRAFLINLRMQERRISQRLQESMMQYRWKGNVRELYNCVQYMAYMGDGDLDLDLLPSHMGPKTVLKDEHHPAQARGSFSNEELVLVRNILSGLQEKQMGRSELVQWLGRHGCAVSEYRLRVLLEKLREAGYLSYGTGRGGIHLMERGFSSRT